MVSLVRFDNYLQDEECAICFDSIQEDNLNPQVPKGHLIRPGLRHAYHENCLDKWLVNYDTCPLCNQPFEDLVRANQIRVREKAKNLARIFFGTMAAAGFLVGVAINISVSSFGWAVAAATPVGWVACALLVGSVALLVYRHHLLSTIGDESNSGVFAAAGFAVGCASFGIGAGVSIPIVEGPSLGSFVFSLLYTGTFIFISRRIPYNIVMLEEIQARENRNGFNF